MSQKKLKQLKGLSVSPGKRKGEVVRVKAVKDLSNLKYYDTGGFGIVFTGNWNNKQNVAIKITQIPLEEQNYPDYMNDFRIRFTRETKLLYDIINAHIVNLYHFEEIKTENNGTQFVLIMELCHEQFSKFMRTANFD